jgi:O-antigen/teichoic acid export membrane protein
MLFFGFLAMATLPFLYQPASKDLFSSFVVSIILSALLLFSLSHVNRSLQQAQMEPLL